MTHDAYASGVLGADLRYCSSGAGQVLLLLHPLRMQLEYFTALSEELATDGLDLLTVDLPGHGHSSAPPVGYTAAYFTDAIETFMERLDLWNVIVVGESIGASIGLGLAARHSSRVSGVVALNPYDYGHWGGIRRSSAIGNLVFTTILLPGIGSIVARSGNKGVLRRVLAGGLQDPSRLSETLLDELHHSGSRPGHAAALRSLSRKSQTWVSARDGYPNIKVPVTLAYGDHDWSTGDERDANQRAIPRVRYTPIDHCGHFSSLEQPTDVACIVRTHLEDADA